MTLRTDAVNRALEEYREYLETLKYIHIDPRVRQKFGMSDIVQITLLEASRDLERIQTMDPAGRKRWLRRMLMNNLLDELAKFLNRPPEVSLEALRRAAQESSRRVRDWIEVEDTSPSEQLIRKEQELRLLEALAQIDWMAKAGGAKTANANNDDLTWNRLPWTERVALELIETEAVKLIEGKPPSK